MSEGEWGKAMSSSGLSVRKKHNPYYRSWRMIGGMIPIMVAFKLASWGERFRSPEKHQAAVNAVHLKTARTMRRLAEDLEGITIKSAQVVGARGDLVPQAYADELGKFHDAVDPHPFHVVRPQIERAIGGPVESVFTAFEEKAIAAASLAQVHRATLKDGRVVAVKIQYPEAERLIKTDTATMRFLTRIASKLVGFDATPFAKDFSEQLQFELEFDREAKAMQRVREMFADDDMIAVPTEVPELSNDRVLVMTWLEGTPLSNPAKLVAEGHDLKWVADKIGQAYVRMIFKEEFFHGDPHPGNLRVTPEGKLGLLDFGLSRELPPGFGKAMAQFIAASLMKDLATGRIAAKQAGIIGDDEDIKTVMKMFAEFVSGNAAAREAEAIRAGKEPEQPPILPNLRVPAHITLVLRAMSLLDGLSARLTPGEQRVQAALMTALMQAVQENNQAEG